MFLQATLEKWSAQDACQSCSSGFPACTLLFLKFILKPIFSLKSFEVAPIYRNIPASSLVGREFKV